MLQINQTIKHKVFGVGTIIQIVQRTDAEPLIYIQFENDTKPYRKFTETSITPFLQ